MSRRPPGGRSPTLTSPRYGTKPARTLSSVVLPQPLGPTIATTCPASTARSTACSADTSVASRARYVTSRPCIRTGTPLTCVPTLPLARHRGLADAPPIPHCLAAVRRGRCDERVIATRAAEHGEHAETNGLELGDLVELDVADVHVRAEGRDEPVLQDALRGVREVGERDLEDDLVLPDLRRHLDDLPAALGRVLGVVADDRAQQVSFEVDEVAHEVEVQLDLPGRDVHVELCRALAQAVATRELLPHLTMDLEAVAEREVGEGLLLLGAVLGGQGLGGDLERVVAHVLHALERLLLLVLETGELEDRTADLDVDAPLLVERDLAPHGLVVRGEL